MPRLQIGKLRNEISCFAESNPDCENWDKDSEFFISKLQLSVPCELQSNVTVLIHTTECFF